MANIRIDTDGLQNNISSIKAYVDQRTGFFECTRPQSFCWVLLLGEGRAQHILIL